MSCVTHVCAGDLKHRVSLQSPELSAAGEESGTWNEEARMWAEIKPLSGRELWLVQQVTPRVTHRIRIRYLSGVLPSWRIKYGTRVFHFDRVINVDEDDVTLEIMAIEAPQTAA